MIKMMFLMAEPTIMSTSKALQNDIEQQPETQEIPGFAESTGQAWCKYEKSTELATLVPYYLLPITYYLSLLTPMR